MAPPKPLLVGRILRVIAGLGCFYFAIRVVDLPLTLGELAGALILALLAASLVVSGLLANPGCEVTAVPNLVMKKKWHFSCPLFSPLDRMEIWLRQKLRS